MKIPRLETERLILRRFTPADFDDFFEYISDEDVVRYEPYTAQNASGAREMLDTRILSDNYVAVEEKATGKVVGNLYLGDTYCECYEMGYVFNRRYWHRGYAFEACTALLDHVFAQGVHRVEADCDPANEVSWKLLERLGFVREGHLKQDIYFRKDEEGRPIWKDTLIYSKLIEQE